MNKISQNSLENTPFDVERCSDNPLTHCCTCRVIYGDTDNMGMAYHANYLRWMEIGRNELFRSWGLTYKVIEEKGIMLPVSEVAVKYVAPAHYDTLLVIETTLDPQIKGGVKFDYRIFDQADSRLLVTSHTLHACVNSVGKVVRPPQFIREIIKSKTG